MPYINPLQDAPNTTIFEPVSSVYENNMTYIEFLLGLLKKMNEMIGQINQNSKFIDDYDGRIEKVEKEIGELKHFLEQAVEEQNEDIDRRFAELNAEMMSMYNEFRVEFKGYADALYQILDEKIDGVAVGQINVLDPTTGMISPLQDVLNNLANSSKDALTASEYDGLSLTATQYDNKNITAFDYDFHGKAILITNP